MSTKRNWFAHACCLIAALAWFDCGGDAPSVDQTSQLQQGDAAWGGGFDLQFPDDWRMYNHDPQGSRWNRTEVWLNRYTVKGLHTLWTFATPAAVSATPVVADNTIYFGDGSGRFYALDRQGHVRWQKQFPASITSSALIYRDLVVFGDQAAVVHGVDRTSGVERWAVHLDSHPAAAFYGSPTLVGQNIAVGVSSNEEAFAADPNYPCCSFRGSVALLSPTDGSVKWQTYMISNTELSNGSSGAGVWGSPSYDAESESLYVTTGNNYTVQTTGTSDAVISLDARSGKVRWVNQRTPNDSWNLRFPFSTAHPDADFGDSPQIYLSHGRKVVGAAQKSGSKLPRKVEIENITAPGPGERKAVA